jgi:hypothetical protein
MTIRLIAAACALAVASYLPVPAGAADPGAPSISVANKAPHPLSDAALDAVTAGWESSSSMAGEHRHVETITLHGRKGEVTVQIDKEALERARLEERARLVGQNFKGSR